MNNIIRVDTIRMNVNMNIEFKDRDLITTHFGRNPIKGGSPPNDMKFNIVVFRNFLFLFKFNWFMKNEFCKFNIKIIIKLIIE